MVEGRSLIERTARGEFDGPLLRDGGGFEVTHDTPEYPNLREYLTHIEEELEALHRTIGGLVERLDPVLKPASPEKSLGEERAMPPTSWMSYQLIRHRDALHEATNRVSDLYRRLDV